MARKQDVFGVTIDGDISGIKKAMDDATRVFRSTERSLKNIEKQLKLDPTNIEILTKKSEMLKKQTYEVDRALEKLYELRERTVNNPNFAKGIDEWQEKFTALELQIAQLEKRHKDLVDELNNMPSPAMQAFQVKLQGLSKTFDEISQKTKLLSTAFSAVGIASVKSAIDYESNVANIKRVVSDLTDSTVEDLKQIAIETGNAFGDVAEYATFAGALGLAENEIAGFAKTMIDLNTATGGAFSGEEGAKSVAVFLKQLHLGIEEAENFGSAIAYIGDKYADVGDETLRVATNLIGLSSAVNVNQYDLIGLAGIMADLGLTSEASSSAITRSFLAVENAIAEDDDKLKAFAKTSGMTAKEFVQAWGKDPVDTFLKFTDGLKSVSFEEINKAIGTSDDLVKQYADTLGWSAEKFKREWSADSAKVFDLYVDKLAELGDEGESASAILKEVGLSGVRSAQTLLRLAGFGDNVRVAISEANMAWNENIALADKSGVIYDTTERKLKGLWESVKQLGGALGDEVLPILKDLADDATGLAQQFAKLDPRTKQLVVKMIALGASLSPVAKGISGLATGISGLISFLAGPGALIALVGSLTVAGIEAFRMIESSTTGIGKLIGELKEENNVLLESIDTADKNYRIREREIDGAKKYAEEIDRLNEVLKNQNLTENEQAEIKDKIRGYIEKLNDALGNEAFYFDEATGKIINQGTEIDKVTSKFDELSAKLKQQSWLETHKDVLNEAYDLVDKEESTISGLISEYQNAWEGFPARLKPIVEEIGKSFTGDITKDAEKLRDYLIEIGEIDLAKSFDLQEAVRIFDNYKKAIEDTRTMIDNANQVIHDYEMVADSNVENVQMRIEAANQSIEIMKGGATETNETLDQLEEKILAYESVLTEEQATHDTLLEKWKLELEEQQKAIQYAQTQNGIIDETKKKVGEIRTEIENLTSQPYYVHIYTVYHNSGLSLGGSRGGSGGFGSLYSGGYGALSNTLKSMANSNFVPTFNSGGYRNNVTLNARFNIQTNEMNRAEAQTFVSMMFDEINTYLGDQI